MTNCPIDLPVAIVRLRSNLSLRKSDIAIVIATIIKEATNPHHPTVISCMPKQ
jgi:hypothetical protein